MAQRNPEESIRSNNFHPASPQLLASLDPYADQYIQSKEVDKVKMLTSAESVKWTVMKVRQQEVLDYTFYINRENPLKARNISSQLEKISMENHEWIFEELSILIQDPAAKAFVENFRQKCSQEIKSYMQEKMNKAAKNRDASSLVSIFPKKSPDIEELSDSSEDISSAISGVDDDFIESRKAECGICYEK